MSLKGDNGGADEVEGSEADGEPENHGEEHGPPADFLEGGARDAAADEEKRQGEAPAARGEKGLRDGRDGGNVGVENGGEAKEEDEPGKLDSGFVMLHGSGGEGERHDPQSPGELHGGGNDQCLRAVFCGGADNGACVVNGEGGPQAELRLGQVKRVCNGRKDEKGDGVQNENRAEGDGHLFSIGTENGPDGGDGAAAANGRSRGDEIGNGGAHGEQFPKQIANEKSEDDAERGVNKAAAAGFQDFLQIHSEAKRNHGGLQEEFCGGAGEVRIRILKAQANENAREESDRRRKECGERRQGHKKEK